MNIALKLYPDPHWLIKYFRLLYFYHRDSPRSPVSSERGGIGAAVEGFDAPTTATQSSNVDGISLRILDLAGDTIVSWNKL